jgi:hypothetical protein
MTKLNKTDILFITMTILPFWYLRQRYYLLIVLVTICSACTRSSGEQIITLPPTFPLSRQVVAYGVVNVSFTKLTDKPAPESASASYLRKGSIVQILERRSVTVGVKSENWVLVDEPAGWIRETEIDLYESESQAQTASEVF